jgi:predicted transcriptional regulator of viral defense system
MRVSESLPKLKPLLKKPLFTSKEARQLGVHPSALTYLAKTGQIQRIRRGVYRGAQAPAVPGFQWSDLVESALSIPNGVICLISALAIYGLTEEIPREHWIAVQRDSKMRVPRPIRIVRYRNATLGKTEINLDGTKVPIYDRERTIVDSFRLLDRELAIKALKMALASKKKDRIDLKKLQQYAKKLRVPITPYLMAVTT